MNASLNKESLELLYNAIITPETVDECREFFEDLCTLTELRAMAQRLLVAKLLRDNNVYSKIVVETGASTATISRVKRSLSYSDGAGYAKVFERLDKLVLGDK